jgi:hypothetical protein
MGAVQQRSDPAEQSIPFYSNGVLWQELAPGERNLPD